MAMKGPLAPWAPGMAERLTTLGYRPRLVERHLHLAGGVSKFLQQRGMAANESEFGRDRTVRQCPAGEEPGVATHGQIVVLADGLLDRNWRSHRAGGCAGAVGAEGLIDRYRDYLTVERGLRPGHDRQLCAGRDAGS